MGKILYRIVSGSLLTLAPLVGLAQVKTLTQITLEDIQIRQARLFEAHNNEENPDDRESLEFRLSALRDEYQVLLNKNKNNVPVLVTFGLFLAQIDQRADSLKLLLKADSLDPNHPQVKNQLGNFMIEEASYALALPFYLDAIRLSPDEPLYHYQLGNLLFYFRREFVEDGVFTFAHINDQIFESFKKAAALAPGNMAYQYRYAEAFYDHPDADMTLALREWERIESLAPSERDKQIVRLHQANVQLQLGNKDLVHLILEKVDDPYLVSNKEKVIKQLEEAESAVSE